MTREISTDEWLMFLELVTTYMLATDEMVDGLQGKLGIEPLAENALEKAAAETQRRVTNYTEARRALIHFAREMEAKL